MKPVTLRDYKERLLRVLVYIQQHLDEPLALETLAARACLSSCHFHRVFTGMIGESLQSHIRRLRLERAATRLKHSTMPVVQVALEAGYETHESFSRAFRIAFATSPTDYRRRHGWRPNGSTIRPLLRNATFRGGGGCSCARRIFSLRPTSPPPSPRCSTRASRPR